jgi:LPS-assembly lipoprotein
MIRVVLACAAASMLAGGCGDSGFRPLYADTSLVGGADVNQKLAELEIAPIPGRVGQRVRNELIYQSTGGGYAAQPVYRLEIVIRESISATLVQIDGNSSGSVYNLNASFRLVRPPPQRGAGAELRTLDFQRFNSVFSNMRARKGRRPRGQDRRRGLKSRLAASVRRRLTLNRIPSLLNRRSPAPMVAAKAHQAETFLNGPRSRHLFWNRRRPRVGAPPARGLIAGARTHKARSSA